MIALPAGVLAILLGQVCVAAGLRAVHADSGWCVNPGVASAAVCTHTVSVSGAAWLQVHFGPTQLAEGSGVRVSSAIDGSVQVLDAETLVLWNGTSAYFNGDTVTVELVAGPMTTGNRFVIDGVAFAESEPEPTGDACHFLCGLCGATDDRVPSGEQWVGRLLPLGCTAAVYSPGSCMISAGHCITAGMVVQFNVPQSSPECAVQHPPPEDQFPVVGFESENNGPGDDWAVLHMGENNLGELPFERYGAYRPLATAPGSIGQVVQVTGYGIDCGDDCELSKTQQTASGAICNVSPQWYSFSADVRSGNDGSALLLDGGIIGVFTHCPCCNIATRADNADFAAALVAFCPGAACAWDLDVDGAVGVVDFLALLSVWGQSGVPADFDGGGVGGHRFPRPARALGSVLLAREVVTVTTLIEVLADPALEGLDQDADLLERQHLVDAGLLDVQDLAAEREDRLGLVVAPALGRPAGGIALDDEEFRAIDVAGDAVGELLGHAAGIEGALALDELARPPRRFAGLRGERRLEADVPGVGGVLLQPGAAVRPVEVAGMRAKNALLESPGLRACRACLKVPRCSAIGDLPCGQELHHGVD